MQKLSYFKMTDRIIRANSGVVLLTVVGMIFAMMILVVGILSSNVNQALTAQHQIERLKAEQLAKGVSWHNYMSLAQNGTPLGAMPPIALPDGKTYAVAVTAGPAYLGPYLSTTAYSATITYTP